MDLLGIRDAGPPAAKQNADPFEGGRAQGPGVALAFGSLCLVVLPRPAATADRAAGPFVKRLAKELRAGQPPVNPQLVPASFGHWRNPDATRQVVRRGIALPLRPQCRNHS